MKHKTVAHLGRFTDIILILFKYGFDDVAERLQLPGKILISKARVAGPEMTTWERLRHALEELGPTFVGLIEGKNYNPNYNKNK